MSAARGFLAVKNFEKYQHYKDRNPPWIKLHNALLDDYDFALLPDASKAHLLAIGLLASRYDNKIPCDEDWIARRINATSAVDLEILVASGFLIPDQACSETLASRKQTAMRETETETETETEKNTPPSGASPRPEKIDDAHAAITAWNHAAPELGLATIQLVTPARRSRVAARLRECGGIDGWQTAIDKIRDSPFLRGDNDRGWRADFDWLCKPGNFAKLMEHGYARSKPNGTHDPAERERERRAVIADVLGLDREAGGPDPAPAGHD